MNGFDRQHLFAALTLLVMALFVTSGFRPASRWHRQLRHAAIVLFVVAVGLALIEIGMWLSGAGW